MTATDTESGLLRAILDMPECDNARLSYADWLDENAGEVECSAKCFDIGNGIYCVRSERHAGTMGKRCPTCSGSGRVSDGRRERSEFIRVQCELAGLVKTTYGQAQHAGLSSTLNRINDFCRRERELAGSPNDLWKMMSLPPGFHATVSKSYFQRQRVNSPVCLVERGFVSTVSAPLAVLVGGECELCRGGEAADPTGLTQCPACHGTGTRRGIADDLIRTQPVLSWLASDRKPGQYANTKEWYWAEWTHNVTYPVSTLPPEVFRLLADQTHVDQLGSRSKHYTTEADALAALSDAVATIAKQQGEKR